MEGVRKLVVIGTIVAVLAAGVFAFRELGTWLSTTDPIEPVDVVVVPAGDPDSRLPVALEHLRAGRADEAWVTVSGAGPILREGPVIDRFAAERGLAERVRILGRARTTRGTAETVARRLRAEDGEGARIAVVTSPWRAARAQLTFSRLLGGDAQVLAWSDGSPYEADRWWEDEASTTALEATKLVGTLALLGARPVSPAEDVPLGLPARGLVAGFVVGALAGAVCRPLARRLRLVAHPKLFRAHAYPVPLLGGVAILVGLGAGVVAGGGFSIGAAGAVAAGGVVTLALVGFVDDLVGLGARSRFLWAALAGGAAWLLGLRVEVLGPGVLGDVGDAALTVIWFTGITHAINLLDNTDGTAAGVVAVSSAAIAGVALVSGQWVVAIGAAALTGSCLGYLVHNVHPARLFMGDLGALGVGFALAALALALGPPQPPPLSFAVAVFALGVPILDTVVVTVSRVRGRRRVAAGGTDHPAHRLIARGWSVRRAAAGLWAAQAVLGAAAFAVATATRAWGWVVAILVGLVWLGGIGLFLKMPAWRPERTVEPVRGIARAIDRAMGPLREVVRAGRADGLDGAERDTIRAAEETLTRLERTRRLLDDE